VCFTVLGVDLAWIFALVTFVCNFVPNVGAIVATLLPVPLIVLDISLPVSTKVLAFVLPFCFHTVVGNLVEPRLFGHRLEIHPIIVLVALGVWSVVWGIAGAILAVPLVCVMRIVIQEIDHPFARATALLLSGRAFDKYGHLEDPLVEISESMRTSRFPSPSPSPSKAQHRHLDPAPVPSAQGGDGGGELPLAGLAPSYVPFAPVNHGFQGGQGGQGGQGDLGGEGIEDDPDALFTLRRL
jgi:hypothetical protein